jgi:recombinational DNA repair protein RecT
MAIDVRSKTQEVVASIQHPDFLEQIRESLPESVSLDRFKRVAITAVRSNPDLVTADQSSLLSSAAPRTASSRTAARPPWSSTRARSATSR